jgi:hypothetical protein
VIALGTRELPVSGTPRGRIGLVHPPGAAAGPVPVADVVWPVSAEQASSYLTELGACLGGLAPGGLPAPGPKGTAA